MKYSQHFRQGHLVLPVALLLQFKDLFPSAEDYLVWQFFFFQNTSSLETIAPSEIAQAIGRTVTEVNQSIERLQQAGLLEFKTINLAGEIEVIFDALPALEKLDSLQEEGGIEKGAPVGNPLKELVTDFEREFGRLLSPFEVEDLQKLMEEDQTNPELIRQALKEAVFNNKMSWNYVQAILRNWRREGITTVVQVEARKAERSSKSSTPPPVSSDFLDAMDLWKE